MRQSDTLETIILSGNDIGNEGGSIMIAALAQNTSLKALYMAGVRTLMNVDQSVLTYVMDVIICIYENLLGLPQGYDYLQVQILADFRNSAFSGYSF